MFHLLLWFVLEVVSTYSTVQKLCETFFMFYLANCEWQESLVQISARFSALAKRMSL